MPLDLKQKEKKIPNFLPLFQCFGMSIKRIHIHKIVRVAHDMRFIETQTKRNKKQKFTKIYMLYQNEKQKNNENYRFA